MSNRIAIAGLGWVGVPLAQRLITLGFRVDGSVTSVEKARMLSSYGIDTFTLEFLENEVKGDPAAFFQDITVLIILIPPGIRINTGGDLIQKMATLLAEIEKNEVEKVILVSSTSVYGDLQGKVTEKDAPVPSTLVGKQLLRVEELYGNSKKIKLSIVRFGGLFGDNREPVRYLAGRSDLNDGNAPVNLIHREDCIEILIEIVKQDAFGFTFNAVIPAHPIKRKYYTEKALELGLKPPHYSNDVDSNEYKQVDSDNLGPILNYSFRKLI